MKVVIFDWGGVVECAPLKDNGFATPWFEIIYSMNPKVSDSEIVSKIVHEYRDGGIIDMLLKNNTDSAVNDFVEGLLVLFGVEPTEDAISKFKKRYIEVHMKTACRQGIINLIYSLKGRCKIGLLSDCNPLDKIRQDIQLNRSKFDYVWLSCDEGIRKNDSEIYIKVMNQLRDESISFNDILLIDDNPMICEIAQGNGLDTLLYENQSLEELESQINDFLES